MATKIYALDAFTASQDGQLTVSKNEELYLLNDDHYYWWYVQSTHNATMGFVPAELLELPNERLARQNSLRNQSVEDVGEIVKKRPSQHKVRFSPGSRDREQAPELDDSDDSSTISDVLPRRSATPPEIYDKVPGMAHNIERMDDLQARLQELIGQISY